MLHYITVKWWTTKLFRHGFPLIISVERHRWGAGILHICQSFATWLCISFLSVVVCHSLWGCVTVLVFWESGNSEEKNNSTSLRGIEKHQMCSTLWLTTYFNEFKFWLSVTLLCRAMRSILPEPDYIQFCCELNGN